MKRSALVFLVWLAAPLADAQPVTFSHFVTPTGSAMSLCTRADPCSLSRAVSLIGTATMPPGSTVLVQKGVDGMYSQNVLLFAGSGTPTAYITFIFGDGVRLTGARVKPAGWTLTPGRTFTYEIPWDETTSFVATSAAQRPPAPTWQPILVDDRLPPFTTSTGHPFTIDFPILYSPRPSLAAIEAQSCTIWDDTAAHKVYIHMCHDGRPVDADNLYLISYQRGTIVINGSWLRLENLVLEQVPGTALKVNPSSRGTILTQVTARAAQIWLDGKETLAEDLDVSHVIVQGPFPGTQCYDANPTFGVGECWNAYGNGRALLIGKEGRAGGNQIVRRAHVSRSWNGGRIDGRNTLEDSTFWGFPNHTLEASGTGVTVRNSAFVDGQDSLFMKTNDFDDMTLEGNVFVGAVYVTSSRDGVGGVRPTVGWRFRYNVLPKMTLDLHAYETLQSDCNVFLSRGDLVRVIGTNGIPGARWFSLAALQAATSFEAHSRSWPNTYWTEGRLVKDFPGQSSPAAFDIGDPLRVCGRRAGP